MNWNLPNPHLRKVRSNKGKKRGPRAKLVSPGSMGLKTLFKAVKAGPKVSTRGIAVPTGFLNTKRRVILISGQGKYFSKTAKGGVTYNPKAKYHKSPGGTERSTKYVKNLMDIPLAIRPKFDRKERSNILKTRGPYRPRKGGVRVLPVKRTGYLTEMFEGYPAKRGRGRPRKASLIGLAGMKIVGQRKTRSNKGTKRGPRKAKNPFAKLMASLN